MGVKAYGGQLVSAGQHPGPPAGGTKFHPGRNVGMGKDDTLFAKIDGYVRFERLGKDSKRVSVYPEPVLS